MQFVVTEKNSVARSVAAVLGASEKKKGYLKGNGYWVSWCVGHLVELAAPSVYDEKYAKWRTEDLPILPVNWQFSVIESTKAQFNVLRTLMNDSRVTSIVCATDAGREGELIFRLVYSLCGCTKPVERLWISSLEDAAIAEGFRNLRPASEYDSLYHAALCRAQADWLVGINATRLFSTRYHQLLNIGRVMTPTLALLVEREALIQAFQSTPFYTVRLDCGSLRAISERLTERAEAERIAALCDERQSLQKSCTLADRTMELLNLAKDRLANRYVADVERGFTRYAKELLGENLGRALLDKNLCLFIDEQGAAREAASFSAGTLDALTLCMRLALVDALFTKEQPFLLLDDPFVNLDDTRTKRALELLQKISQQRQVVYLVCNSARV